MNRPIFYTLIGKLPVPADLHDWAVWFVTNDQTVMRSQVGPLIVSTVFLGFDHGFFGGEPRLFETMIFDDGGDNYQTRCTTWDEAEEMHAAAVLIAEGRVRRADENLRQVFTSPPNA